MQLKAAGLTDVGMKRSHNEDTLLLREDLGLYLVADGMGGHAGGEVASSTAAEVVQAYISGRQHIIAGFDDSAAGREALVQLVKDAVEASSREVYKKAATEEGRAGMGTTLTLMLVVGDKAVMGHVGDSRLYLLRKGLVHQLSEDHSYIAELVKKGYMTKEEAAKSPFSNVITRAVGIQESVQVDTLFFDVLPGDTYMLCSDGLSRYMEDNDELAEVLKGAEAQALPARLVAIANERGGRDNITSLLVRAEGERAPTADPRSTEVNLRVDTLKFISMFRHLTMKELLAVLEILRVETCATGEVIIAEGEASDSLYVVLSGELEVTRQGQPIAKLASGTHFGEMALLNQKPRVATVKAVSTSRLLVMDRTAFNVLVRRQPTLGVKFLWTLAQVLSLRLDEANAVGSLKDPDTLNERPFSLE
jgi:PPM family protein phosphatase